MEILVVPIFFPWIYRERSVSGVTSAMSVDAIDAVLNGAGKDTVCDLFTVITIRRTGGSGCACNVGDATAKIIAAASPIASFDGKNSMNHPSARYILFSPNRIRCFPQRNGLKLARDMM